MGGVTVVCDGNELSLGDCVMGQHPNKNVMRVRFERRNLGMEDTLILKNCEGEGETIPLGHALGCPAMLGTSVADNTGSKIHLACCAVPERINPTTKEREVLITRRHEQMRAFPNIWVFPGGHVDKGEELHEAVRREFKEETGIQASESDMKCIAMWESVYPPESEQGKIRKQHIIFFYSLLLTEEDVHQLRLCPVEVSAAAWLNKHQVEFVLYHNQDKIPLEHEEDTLSFSEEDFKGLRTFDGIIVHNNAQSETKFNLKESLCGSDLSVGKERTSTATSFVLAQWFRQQK